MNGTVSIIIPVYNSAPHLPQCLDSILSQTYPDFEVICVDDCSTDESASIVETYMQRSPAIQLVRHEQNRGVSAARNTGMARAQGRYILCVDSDDFISPDLLARAVDAAQQHDAQMTFFGFDEYYSETNAFVPREMFQRTELADKTFALTDLTTLNAPSTELVTPNVWRILYDRSFLDSAGITFHEDLPTSEDLAFIYETFLAVERIYFLPERLYHYRRDGGITLTRGERGAAGYRALDYIVRFARDTNTFESAYFHLVNIVADVAEYAMGSTSTLSEYLELHKGFVEHWLPFVSEHPDFLAPRYQTFFDAMQNGSSSDYLFRLYAAKRQDNERLGSLLVARDVELTRRAEELHAAIDREHAAAEDARRATERANAAEEETRAVRDSWSYRIGNTIVFLPSKIKHLRDS